MSHLFTTGHCETCGDTLEECRISLATSALRSEIIALTGDWENRSRAEELLDELTAHYDALIYGAQ